MSTQKHPTSGHALPTGTILHDNYIIRSVLGEGGFGITYFGIEKLSGQRVAIKEYYPSGIAVRNPASNPLAVSHMDGNAGIIFEKGLRRFLNEAKLLQEFQHLKSIVSPLDAFEENNTVYLVMEFIEGITLKSLIQSEGPLPYEELFSLMKPVFLDLDEIHQKGLIHRDISPDNLIVGIDNKLHLIDFGAASFSNPNETKTMTVILKSGYAPPEQYVSDGKIGAWTDVYALCATMYMALTGQKPVESIKRMQDDTLSPISEATGIKNYQQNAIAQGLRLNYTERYSSVKGFLYALTTPMEYVEDNENTVSYTLPHNSRGKRKKANRQSFNKRMKIYGVAVIGLLILWLNISTNFTHPIGYLDRTSEYFEKSIANTLNDRVENLTRQTNAYILDLLDNQILTMVNVVGMPYEDAKQILEKMNPQIQIQITEEYNDNYDSGIVIFQSIAETTQFTKGQLSQIQLTISKGTKPITPSTQTANKSDTGIKVKGTEDSGDEKYTPIPLD